MSKNFVKARDPMSSYTHFIGACLSVFGTLLLAASCLIAKSSVVTLVSGLVFCLSLIALYSASSIYHFARCTPSLLVRLRKLDHAMIYVLIAGTYTPIAVGFMDYNNAKLFVFGIWAAAVAGIVIKVFWLNAPRWLYTSLYLVMGWAILFDYKAFGAIPSACLALIAGGGISYSIGAVIYILKKPNISKSFGFHEIFHVFVMIGSLLHFIAIYFYIIK